MNLVKYLRAGVVVVTAAFFSISGALAGDFPSRPIRFVVPYGPSGSSDVLARVVAQKLSEAMGQPVIVENRPGAGGIVASDYVAKSKPDGYTILVGDTGFLSITPSLFKKLPYDPLKDFAPITLAITAPLFLAVNTEASIASVDELVKQAKGSRKLSFSSSGNGSVHHLSLELLKILANIDMVHIPYKGVAQSVPAVITGEVACVMAALPSLMPHVRSGRLRLLGVATRTRSSIMPEVPAIAESVPGYEITIDLGFVAPRGTPPEIIQRLNGEMKKVLAMPDVVEKLRNVGLITVGSSPQQYSERISTDFVKFADLVKRSGAKPD